MIEKYMRIEFLSDWHIGSGLGDGSIADTVLNRDINGIPRIPGSAIKGALREGAWRLALCGKEKFGPLVDFLFGTASTARATNQSGRIFVGAGHLQADLQNWLLAQEERRRKEFVRDMTLIRAQTQLDSSKMVVPNSLRSMECGIPGLSFTATITVDVPADAEKWLITYLRAICACVGSMGGDRSRGLGRCKIVLSGQESGKIVLPGTPPASLGLQGVKNENS